MKSAAGYSSIETGLPIASANVLAINAASRAVSLPSPLASPGIKSLEVNLMFLPSAYCLISVGASDVPALPLSVKSP